MRKPTKKDTMAELKEQLDALNLSTQGKKETLFKRLWKAATRLAASATSEAAPQVDEARIAEPEPLQSEYGHQPYRSFLCFDVEATCSGGAKEFDFPNEIIEFPVVLLQWAEDNEKPRLKHVDTFHSYVRPTWRPTLTAFCTELTGITQGTVDASPTFPEMIVKLEEWLEKHDLLSDGYLSDALWVTDGPWDLRDFIPKQLHITPLHKKTPYLFGPYLNIKQAVQSVLLEEWKRDEYARKHPPAPNYTGRTLPRIGTGRNVSKMEREQGTGPMRYGNIKQMLGWLDIGEFEGRLHSGIDDATNISRILIALADRNVLVEPNARLPPSSNMKKWDWMGKPGEVLWQDSKVAIPEEALTNIPVVQEEVLTESSVPGEATTGREEAART